MVRNKIIKQFILLILILCSCKHDNLKQVPNEVLEANNKWIGEQVSFFKSINPLSQNLEITKNESSFTIVAYYDANCSLCFFELTKWVKEIEDFNIYDVSFKFILTSNNITSLKINLENIQFPITDVYHDGKDEFGNRYNFLLDHGYYNSSMLLDNNNKIIYVGNPTISQAVKEKYVKIMML